MAHQGFIACTADPCNVYAGCTFFLCKFNKLGVFCSLYDHFRKNGFMPVNYYVYSVLREYSQIYQCSFLAAGFRRVCPGRQLQSSSLPSHLTVRYAIPVAGCESHCCRHPYWSYAYIPRFPCQFPWALFQARSRV